MTSHFVHNDMSSKDRAQYGAALAKGAAFDAVYSLWRRRSSEGWTRARVATNVGVDESWLSKQFIGPRNWTMESLGTLVIGLEGDVEIIVRAAEDQAARANYDAYSEYDIYSEHLLRATLVPPEKKCIIEVSRNDPLLKQILGKSEPAPVPLSK